ncbi:MAG TPA: response regulator [Acidobacteriaceae bacterium]|jgi:response regulator RpfG family c-di-GMP phosphodiesterase
MTRPCFLVIDPEHAGSISSRKLVLETAKFNVVTAYGSHEAIETLRRFPAMDGVVVNASMADMPCADLIRGLRSIRPEVHIIAISSPMARSCEGANRQLESFDPPRLLDLLRELCPTQTREILNREEELAG